MMIAVESVNNKIGMMNIRAKTNFAKNVAAVASQISFVWCLFSASSEMCMPKASDSASAIAITKIPPKIIVFEPVPECNPTINPRVVIIPDVRPKLKPFFIDSFIIG